MSSAHQPVYLDRVRQRLQAAPTQNPSRPGDRQAAVMLALLGQTPAVVGILRPDDGSTHGGQFALPGGGRESGETSWECAIRETREEIGPFSAPELLGVLGEFNTYVSRYQVTVHVAYLPAPPRWQPQEGEVAGILTVPLQTLEEQFRGMPRIADPWKMPIELGFHLDPEEHLVAGTSQGRGRGHRVSPDGGKEIEVPYVWGLTARVIYDFLNRAWVEDESNDPGINTPGGSHAS